MIIQNCSINWQINSKVLSTISSPIHCVWVVVGLSEVLRHRNEAFTNEYGAASTLRSVLWMSKYYMDIECHFINQNMWRNTRLWDIILSMANLCVWGSHWNERSMITVRVLLSLSLSCRENIFVVNNMGNGFHFPHHKHIYCGCQKMYLYKVAIYTVFSFSLSRFRWPIVYICVTLATKQYGFGSIGVDFISIFSSFGI